jgi:Protein of unknown function (DUF1203)
VRSGLIRSWKLRLLPKIVCPKTARLQFIEGLGNGMNTNPAYPFRVSGISADVIDQYRHLSDQELLKHRVVRQIADNKPGFPCRVSLADAEIGESVLLLNFEHLPGLSPYRSVGPIFVRESATETYSKTNEIPGVLRLPSRLLSVRAYDDKDILAGADVMNAMDVEQSIQRFFGDARVAYIHVHNAGPGCYACRVDRP